ncbi:Ig-like domain-containing protein [Actinomycetes bacterium KLBMP 9759]
MKRHRGPLLTLLALIALGGALLAANGATATPPNAVAESAPAPEPPVVTTPPPAPVQVAYAGRTAGKEATIAIAVSDGRAVAYLCDGKKVEAWLEGTVENGALALRAEDGATASGTVTGEAVDGTVTTSGATWDFTAERATATAGTYRADTTVAGVQTRIGWNVLNDNTVTGLRRDASGVAPAPPLDPARRSTAIDGSPLDVRPVTGADRIDSGGQAG